MPVHPTAVVANEACVDPTADIGPFVVIDGAVSVGPGTRVYPHAYLTGHTEIGAGCEVHPGAVVGHLPQDLAYGGEETYCRIGDATVIREHAQVHRGTDPGSTTLVGARCYLMSGAHVGHNCTIEDEVIFASGALTGGHVRVGRGAFLSGNATVHQFVRIGERAMLAGLASVNMDVPPFMMIDREGKCATVNTVGMRRAGFTQVERQEIKRAFRLLYRVGGSFGDALVALEREIGTDPGRRLLEFLRAPSRRGITGPSNRRGAPGPPCADQSSAGN